jgi:predicted nucleotide-binding protein
MNSRDKAFIVYGRDHDARAALKRALEGMGLEVLDWERAIVATGKGSPHASEVLQAAMRSVKAVVVLMTGDTEARLLRRFCTQEELDTEGIMRPQARQNVIFEAGLAFALFPNSTIHRKDGPTHDT